MKSAKFYNLNILKLAKSIGLAALLAISAAASGLGVRPVFAQGITIPAGSTFDINNATLNVAGSIVTVGTIETSTGTISLSGDWDNSNGTYNSGTGTLMFSGSAGTQTMDSGGTVVGKRFYNVTHSGAGTLRIINNNIDIDNDFQNLAGTFESNGQDIFLQGDWTNAVGADYEHAGSETVRLDGSANQTLFGTTDAFYNLVKIGTDSLLIEDLEEVYIEGTLTLMGTGIGTELTIDTVASNGTDRHEINLVAGGLQVLQYLNINNSSASNLDLFPANSIDGTNTDSGEGSPRWVFGGGTFTWDGSTDTDWDDPSNWDVGAVPDSNDLVIIPDVSGASGNFPVLNVPANVEDMQITGAATTLTLDGFALTIDGTLDNAGTIILGEGEAVSIATVDTNSGTFRFIGDGDGIADTFNFPVGVSAYYNVEIIDTDGGLDTFQTNNVDLVVNGNLTVTTGILDASTNDDNVTVVGNLTVAGGQINGASTDFDIDGNITLSSGTFVASNSVHTFTLGGNWTKAGAATFTNSSGTINLDGSAATQILTGDTTFYGLINTYTTGQTITFTVGAGNTITVDNYLQLQGASSADRLIINSTVAASDGFLTLTSGVNAQQDVEFVSVQDNDASGGLAIIARSSIEAVASSTTNWFFNGGTFTWDGSTDTDWDDPDNWDIGIVPEGDDTAIIPNVANDPILNVNANVENLTISTGGILTTDGFDLVVDGTLSNDGTVVLQGDESTVTIGTPDTDSGTFTYAGDNNGANNSLTIFNLSSGVDYYNLLISDVNVTTDDFLTSGTVSLGGTLDVTAGEFDISTNSGTLVSAGTITLNGGTFTATNGNIDANGDVALTTGTLVAPGAAQSFTVGGSWTKAAPATFTTSSGEVVLDSTATATITGDTTFFDLESIIPTKIIRFAAGSTQTIDGTLNFVGDETNDIVLQSTTGGVDWNIDFPNGAQVVSLLDVSDSEALSNDVRCFNCTNSGGNDDGDPSATAQWEFVEVSITVPANGEVVDLTPTIIGTGSPGFDYIIRNGAATTVASGTIDANGNFMVEVDTASAFSDGVADTLQACILPGPICGTVITINPEASPSTDDVPTITNYSDGDRVSGALVTFEGKGAAGQTVTVTAYDENENLLLTDVGTGTVDGSGNYSVTITTALPKSINYISVTVNGVASDILLIKLTDPFGIVFDSATNAPVSNATVTIYRSVDDLPAEVSDCLPDDITITTLRDLDCTDVNPVVTGTDGFYSFITVDANYYIVVEKDDYDYPSALSTFPSGRTIVTGSKGEEFTVAGVVIEMDQPLDGGAGLIRITKDANKTEARVGEIVTYTITAENLTDNDLLNVFIHDRIPTGFKYVEGRAIVDGQKIADPTGNRPVVFSVGTIATGQTITLKYQLVIGSGVTVGEYLNEAYAKNSVNIRISNLATETVKIIEDPLFDLGTALGKVFWDRNENGVQDAPTISDNPLVNAKAVIEEPIPNVRLVMEDGTVITTDRFGRYSVPALTPGRHLIRLDERTLPEGAYLTTDKVVIIDVTEGLLVKANFGVNFSDQTLASEDHDFFFNKVKITQDDSRPNPRLHVALYGDEIPIYDKKFVENVEFRIFSNYTPFINSWKLEVADRDTKRTVKVFEGNRFNINEPIAWDGKDQYGNPINVGFEYDYFVEVMGRANVKDSTKSVPIVFKEIANQTALDEYLEERKEDRKTYVKWLEFQETQNSLLTQNILVDGQTVIVDPLSTELKTVRIMKDNEVIAYISVTERHGLTAQELLDEGITANATGDKPFEIILPDGDYDIYVEEKAPQANKVFVDGDAWVKTTDKPLAQQQSGKSYKKPIVVGGGDLFFVAMGDGKLGYTFAKENIEPVAQEDKYRDGFWQEGQFAYYLKGKILGKYLVTSSFDTERERKEIFRNLDEDEYYPIYGDTSKVDYQATNTQGNLYALVEWDKSSALWGNYSIAFEDTEFGRYTRSLYGMKVDFKSLEYTEFGDAKSKAIVFNARAQQKSAHNEFLATGGSLYFLRNKDVIQGSDKIKIEVRDKITGLVISSAEMVEGADYEMDYSSGRMLFWRPVPTIVESYSIVSSELLDGNLVYVIADYEYAPENKVDESTYGARGQYAVTDNVLVGSTYVSEDQDGGNYELRGADVTLKINKDTTIIAEYAETSSEAQGVFLSTDGGLSFTEQSTADGEEGRAYGIKGDTRLFNRIGSDIYYKWIGNDFSTSATTAQQGKELYGTGMTFDITDDTRFILRYDVQALVNDGTTQSKLQLGAQKTTTTMAQIVHELNRVRIKAEYQYQEVENRLDEYETQTNVETNAVAVAVAYDVNDKLEISIEQQIDLEDTENNQTTLGAAYSPTDKLTISAKEIISSEGASTAVGVTADMGEKIQITGQHALTRTEQGEITQTTTVGAATESTIDVDDQTKLRSSVSISDSNTGALSSALTLGSSKQVDDQTVASTDVTFSGLGAEGETRTYTFGTTKKISDDLEFISSRTFGDSDDGTQSFGHEYGLSRVKDGKELKGTLSRKYSDGTTDVSRTNIFGLKGDIDDRWAAFGSYETGDVQNIDGTRTDRSVISGGLGYVKEDPVTGETFKSSTKLEVRNDQGEEDIRQYVFATAAEGQLTTNMSAYIKLEYSQTYNLDTGKKAAESKEFVIGGAYRPINVDNLNLLARYTYLENQSPISQVDNADIEDERSHVIAAEAVYDLSQKWQISEKVAYRILEEKVEGFDFTNTHTWLMIHRLNYKIDYDWSIGAEYRVLAQQEAKDSRQGFLIEAARRVGEYAQIGVGYNFTDFEDDLTNLDYQAQGPFIRLTGKLYDRSPEEVKRARERWLNQKVEKWAWAMVDDELTRTDSPILNELNRYFDMAQWAYDNKKYDQAKQIYRDIIVAGQMMHEEAMAYIRSRVGYEQDLQEMYEEAESLIEQGYYDKAKKILEKILEEGQ